MKDSYKFPSELASARVSYKEPGKTNYRISPKMIGRIDRELKVVLKDSNFWEEINESLKETA
ncbi:hypothetical protein CO038_02730 [Candidatus Pacearchaeota archaeon CG_4_9_14_0_2_um_filter_39_13]|nr:hypothetical protein [Candidatus Pacearchaeota archaeon]OIO43092.1 MAG: hypothetical protein AUJ64_02825 [Candidatus Pacearchaeota archaeon CG1_02_39_14]PJC44632.1 MAG: hypothetical protein CO038_02730 [Candidatus Pacearchaeota archaeon CG_4_9_14_0_2_um_filter_39_13]